tara:strand:- start:104 stop:337 length:234 start_codon:yes stop_codon:yes gene_type:complete
MIFIEQEQENFSKQVEKYVLHNGGTYLDAVICISEKMSISPEMAGKLVTKPLKEKLQMEATKLNYNINVPKGQTSLF